MPSRRSLLAGLVAVLSLLAIAPGARAATLAPNLRGQIMILVYHRFGPQDFRWTRSWASFDHDLARLEAAGYRPITLAQYAAGNFVVPAGTTPVVLTFDDSTANQIKYDRPDHLAADCALAHWVAFAHQHPDFPVRGVFFINPGHGGRAAFEQARFAVAKLHQIVQLGGEVGNHTMTHANLKKAAGKVSQEIGQGEWELERVLPGYKLQSFALPFGIYPVPEEQAWHGTWRAPDGSTVSWNYVAVVKVGANPAPSPFVAGFDPHHLPRIQAFDPELDKWLEYFEHHPERRFISDGKSHARASLPR